MEKHVQTIVVSLVLLLLSWAGWTALDTRERVARMEVQMTNLAVQISAMQGQLAAASDDRYRSSDARRDFTARDERIKELEARVIILEKEAHREHNGVQEKTRQGR